MRFFHSQRGLSLLETIVWVSVTLIVVIAISDTLIAMYRASGYSIQEASAISSAQRGVDELVKEIREASYASNGAYPIVSMAPNDIVFYANTDSDELVERVHYYVSGTELYRGVLKPSGDPYTYTGAESVSTISDYVQNLNDGQNTFTYYDENGALIADFTKIGSVRYVVINLNIDVDPNRSPVVLTLRSSAAMRNVLNY